MKALVKKNKTCDVALVEKWTHKFGLLNEWLWEKKSMVRRLQSILIHFGQGMLLGLNKVLLSVA